jgi:hypothetical protein
MLGGLDGGVVRADTRRKMGGQAMTIAMPKNGEEVLQREFEGLGGSLEQRVQELADREEIREIVARYAQLVVRRRSPAHLFTEDGALIINMPGFRTQEIRGMQALEAMFQATAARPALSMPAVHNHVITVAGDEAVGTSWIELYVSDDASPDGRAFAGTGFYEDVLRRVSGRWKFVSRTANVLVVGAAQRANPITKS